jgi:death-on-curing protein
VRSGCGSAGGYLETPGATFGGEYLHSDLFSMAAAYAFHIAESQAFVDGNKRTGLNAALDKTGLGQLLQELARPDGDEPTEAS